MNFEFNKNIEILYGINYCINKDKGTLKIFNTKEENELINIFYKIYKNNISEEIKNKILSIGDYDNLSAYALNNKELEFIDYSIFNEFFNKLNTISNIIIKDIKSKKNYHEINFNSIKEFYNFNLADNIKIYLSIFISGGFGIFINNTSNIILGIKQNKETNKYGITGMFVCKIYHEFSHPYIHEILSKTNLSLKDEDNNILECYNNNNLIEETLVRVIEIIFSSKILGDDYTKWAIEEQEKTGFKSIKKFIEIYNKNKNSINNINDYINILIDNNVLIKGENNL